MVDKETVRRGYDAVGGEFAARRSFDERERQVLAQFRESLPPGAVVLDAGCGDGTPILRRLVERQPDARPIGLDISAAQLDRAAERAPGATLLQGDLTRLPLAASTVDAVVACYSLVHVPADEHRDAIDEFARVVRPGGRVLLSEGTDHWQGRTDDWLEAGAEMEWHIAGAEATRRQLGAAGLAVRNEWTVTDVLVDGESWRFFDAVVGESD